MEPDGSDTKEIGTARDQVRLRQASGVPFAALRPASGPPPPNGRPCVECRGYWVWGAVGRASVEQLNTKGGGGLPPPPRDYPRTTGKSHIGEHPWPCVTFTLLVVVSTSQPGVFVMTAYRTLIRPSGEDAMGRSCILGIPPGQGDARSSADACLS